MRKARAAVYDAPKAPFVIREYPLRDVRADEALVRVSLSTVCGSDVHSYLGHRPNPCPGILGHEIVGVIEQLGERVGPDLRGERLAVGDRVTWTAYHSEGSSYQRDVLDLPQKSPGVRKYGHDFVDTDPHFNGGFAEYCYLVPGTGIVKLPAELLDEEAAPINCGVATMVAVTEAAQIEKGDRVVVQGAGLLGLYGCAIAKARGAAQVIAIDNDESRLERAQRFGADATFCASRGAESELIETVRDLAPPDGPDVVLEVCGVPDAVRVGLQLLRTAGRYVLAGFVSPGAELAVDANDIVRKCLTIRGVHNYHPRHLVEAVDFVHKERERFPFRELVDAKFSLDEINEAFRVAAERSVLRAGVVP